MDSATPQQSHDPDRARELLRESLRVEKDRAKQWLLLKPTIQRLLSGNGRDRKTHSQVVNTLKEQYGFNAFGVDKLKYQLQQWKMGTSLPARVKRTICKAIQRRRVKLDRSSIAKYRNQKVDPQKLRRWLQEEEAKSNFTLQPTASGSANNRRPISGQDLQLGGKTFMNLNLPIGVLRSLMTIYPDHTSPASPMSDIIVETPTSTGDRPSPRDAASPMTVVARMVSANERARLFVEGRHFELLRSMGMKEQWTTASWAYQLWQYFFRTARHWGRGPLKWTVSNLGLENHQGLVMVSSPNTPSANTRTRVRQEIPPTGRSDKHTLCKWSIHMGYYYGRVENLHYNPPSPELVEEPDLEDEASWTPWPTSMSTRSFTETIQQGIEINVFSNIRMQELPIGLTQIIKAIKRSPNELLEEAFGFSIMARNYDLVEKMLGQICAADVNVSGLHPFHLATTYLDGSRTCCNILDYLVLGRPNKVSIRKLYMNDLGHTVLDNLMITILRSHTSCSADLIDSAFTKNHRFAGEEVDICGRWDADSDCVRQLLANGNPAIPFEWRHMFCHTSVQTICHCIGTIFGPRWGPDINSPSGLFTQRCSNPECGEKLVVLPLHTLVLTAIHLAESGCKGENLFGMLASLLCLLSNGANPLLKAQISPEALLGHQSTEECTHKELDPMELANQVPVSVISRWTSDVRTGWKIFCYVLRDSQAQWRPKPSRQTVDEEMMDYMERFQPMRPYNTSTLPSVYGMESEELYGNIGMSDGPFTFADIWNANNGQQIPVDTEILDADRDSSDDDETEDEQMPAECSEEDWHVNYFGESTRLSTLWAAVQTELVTYRRLKEGDPWLSPNFDMLALVHDFEDDEGTELSIDLVTKNMMNDFCECGLFFKADDYACVRMEEASAYYFSNLEKCEWTRRKYIDISVDRCEQWLN